MDRPDRAEHTWQLVNLVLLRQFRVRSLAALVGWGFLVSVATRNHQVVVAVLMGGGWMVMNCLAVVWVGSKVFQTSRSHAERYVLGFVATVLGLFVLAGWFIVVHRPSLLWLTIGLTTPLVIFLYQLMRLRRRIDSDAR